MCIFHDSNEIDREFTVILFAWRVQDIRFNFRINWVLKILKKFLSQSGTRQTRERYTNNHNFRIVPWKKRKEKKETITVVHTLDLWLVHQWLSIFRFSRFSCFVKSHCKLFNNNNNNSQTYGQHLYTQIKNVNHFGSTTMMTCWVCAFSSIASIYVSWRLCFRVIFFLSTDKSTSQHYYFTHCISDIISLFDSHTKKSINYKRIPKRLPKK